MKDRARGKMREAEKKRVHGNSDHLRSLGQDLVGRPLSAYCIGCREESTPRRTCKSQVSQTAALIDDRKKGVDARDDQLPAESAAGDLADRSQSRIFDEFACCFHVQWDLGVVCRLDAIGV